MDSSIIKKANELLGEKNRRRRWQISVTALAAVVVISTAYILSKPAQTLVKDISCGIEEHTHTEECYGQELLCGYTEIPTLPSDTQDGAAEGTVTWTTQDIQDAENSQEGQNAGDAQDAQNSQSGQEDHAAQEMTESQAPESQAHQHDETCYTEEQELICNQDEDPGHVHTEACKTVTENRELTCGQEESQGHTHTEECRTVTENRELTCGQEESAEHTHADSCYTVSQTEELTCGQEESTGHAHTDDCYTVNQTEELTCGQEERAGHLHMDTCYETIQKLVCGREETEASDSGVKPVEPAESAETAENTENPENIENPENTENPKTTEDSETTNPPAHVHTEECFMEVLTCKAEEHAHDDQCYEEVFCGIAGHTHGVNCYDENGSLTCETAEHRHEANCYKEPHCGITVHIHSADCHDEAGNPVCGTEEHIHTDECYITNTYYCAERVHVHDNDCYDLEGNLLCGSADYQNHIHSEACYDKNERLICPLSETEEAEAHIHAEECYGVRGILICGQTEVPLHEHDESCRMDTSDIWVDTVSATAYCGTAAHTHRDNCRDSDGNVICGLEEHMHTEECFEATGYGCTAQIHMHEAACYDGDGNVQCGLADYVLHTHSRMCYGLNGVLLCTLPEAELHVHHEACYSQESQEAGPALTCTLAAEIHEHTDSCRDADGGLSCGILQITEHEHTEECIIDAAEIEITQTYRGPDFIVTASYNKKEANLPEDARLYAERITEEGNEAYYAERAAQYQEMQGAEEENTMQVLMRIGFTAEGAEAEPEGPVTIRVQFLDENGMEEGSPVTVVHFGEAGTERLEGSNAEKNGTTFRMNSFSEIALGWKKPVKTVAVDKTFTYEDDAFTVKFHVEGEAILPDAQEIGEAVGEGTAQEEIAGPEESGQEENVGTDGEAAAPGGEETDEGEENVTEDELEAVVEALDENAEAYEAALTYAEETGTGDEILSMQVLSYGLIYKGMKLDLTGCRVAVEVTPTEALVEFAEGGEASTMAIDSGTDEPDQKEAVPGEEIYSSDVSLVAVDIAESEAGFAVKDIYGSLVVDGETTDESMTYEAAAQGTDNIATIYASSQANPEFTVEFYANIEVLAATHASLRPITVIDTSGDTQKQPGQDNAILPTNGGTMKKKNIYVSEDGRVQTQMVEEEIYSAGTYHYVQAPGLVYFNKIAKNQNYILNEIRVQREDSDTWELYSCADGKEWHFTNKRTTQEENRDDFILITEGATIRLIYNCREEEVRNGADFYDYDVSDGRVYTEDGKAADRGNATTHESGDTWYLYTNRQGINSNRPDQTFGFGNSETSVKTTMGDITGNMANADNAAYGSPTFGMVTGLKDDKIQYAPTVKAPNLFNDGDAEGKTAYSGNLVFRQMGDTYTLTGAEVVMGEGDNKEVVSSVYGIDRFNRQRNNWNNTYYFAGNDFYPLDTVPTAGTGGHDLLFGSPASVEVTKNSANKDDLSSDCCKMPESDDGLNHNHYFGMHYTVEFDLVEDYVGPLEYLFYGDDDMWVFLDGPGYNGKLICDIGGVHSSVGEYVNLWDYIDKGTNGKYRLTFYYTERGASGSTCWMQFTLPSVSFATTEQDTGKLRIEKQVTGNEMTDEEFGFTIHFYRTSGDTKEEILAGQTEENALKNDYSYTKYDSSGKVIESDILIWNDSRFTLKAGQYIVVSFLPEGSSYAIEEIGPVTVSPKEPGEDISWEVDPDDPYSPIISGGIATDTKRKIIGTITKDGTVEIAYNNLYEFSLPETGGTGTATLYALAGAFGILSGAGLMYRRIRASKGRKIEEGRVRR